MPLYTSLTIKDESVVICSWSLMRHIDILDSHNNHPGLILYVFDLRVFSITSKCTDIR